MSKSSGWDQRLIVSSDGKGLVGHAGAVLLRRCADRTGLTRGLNQVLPRGNGPGWWDRGTVLVSLAVTVVLGATSMSDIGLLAHQGLVFGDRPSEATVRRTIPRPNLVDKTVKPKRSGREQHPLTDRGQRLSSRYLYSKWVRCSAAATMSPIRRGLIVVWRSVFQRPIRIAKPCSPCQRRPRSSRL